VCDALRSAAMHARRVSSRHNAASPCVKKCPSTMNVCATNARRGGREGGRRRGKELHY
jgi:hypothetical protein